MNGLSGCAMVAATPESFFVSNAGASPPQDLTRGVESGVPFIDTFSNCTFSMNAPLITSFTGLSNVMLQSVI